MSWAGALVLFAVIWFLCLFITLPLRIRTQAESGKIQPGTPGSAPINARLQYKVKLTTLIATVIWALVCLVIMSDLIMIADLDLFGRWQDGHYG